MTLNNQSWKLAVSFAFLWNLTLSLFKFIVFAFTWSMSIFSEWVHSIADTINQLLLYVGLKKSKKRADNEFAYWYWKERFFWAILSACWIFFIWAWVTIYRWIEGLFTPHLIENYSLTYFILLVSFLIEISTLFFAINSIYKKEKWFLKSIKESDNASLAVILEDSVAIFSLIIAFLAIFLSKITGYSYFDSIWSIIIWVLLWFVAILLIIKNKEYLIWKTIDENLKKELIKLIKAEPIVLKLLDFKSQVIDINTYIIKCEIEYNWTDLIKHINKNWFLQENFTYINNDYEEFVRFCVGFADRAPRVIWKSIDKLENKIKKRFPEIRHIDIELN